MKKIFLVIANYKDDRQRVFEENISPINEAYCKKHGFEYVFIKNTPQLFRQNPIWWKFLALRDMISSETLKDGDVFTSLDSDMVIVKDDALYQTDKSFSYAIDNGNTHCMGSFTLIVNSWSRNMVNLVLDEQRYLKNKDRKIWTSWADQASWYDLCGIKDHSWIPFTDLPNYGWHSDESCVPHFSIEELRENIEIRGPEWNTTLLAEEANDPVSRNLQLYNIVRSKKEDTIIRHFAGGQPWNPGYFKKWT